MKVDLSRPNSMVTGRLAESRENKNRALHLGESQHVPTEKQKKTDPPAREVSNRQIPFDNLSVRLKFQSDEETGERVIQLIDSETGEVVRQIPPEELLHVIKALRDLKGMLFSTIS